MAKSAKSVKHNYFITLILALIAVSTFLCGISFARAKEGLLLDKDFRLISTGLRSFSLTDFQNKKKLLLIAHAPRRCPAEYLENTANEIAAQSQDMDVAFVDPMVPLDSKFDLNVDLALKSVIQLYDPVQLSTNNFGFKNSGDFLVINTKDALATDRGNVFLLGRNKSSREIREQFEKEVSKTDSISVPTAVAVSAQCSLGLETHSFQDFQKDFLTSFSKTCLRCHIDSQTFDVFKSIDQVVQSKAMNLRMMQLGRMPGSYRVGANDIDSKLGNDEDVRRIAQWLQSNHEITPMMRTLFQKERLKIEAEKISTTEQPPIFKASVGHSISIPAAGQARYFHFVLNQKIDEDLDIYSVRLKTNLNVVHHAQLFSVAKDSYRFNMDQSNQMSAKMGKRSKSAIRGNVIFGSINGVDTQMQRIDEPIVAAFNRTSKLTFDFPNDEAFRVIKGNQLVLQLHVEPSGRVENLETNVEVFGGKKGSRPRRSLRLSVNPGSKFEIKPTQKSYIVVSKLPVTENMRISSLWIHTHNRGVAAKVDVIKLDGSTQVLAHIPYIQTKLQSLKVMPNQAYEVEKGSQIVTRIEYDNSTGNSANPDSSRTVRIGGRTLEDEMYSPRINYSVESVE